MSRVFISHSSSNNAEAIALRDWMVSQGWNDIFLDLDPERGLKAGQRWQEALKQAAERCELVIFLISPAWACSKWCLAEFLLAKSLNKRIFAAIVEPTSFDAMPIEITAEWQIVDLTAGARDHRALVVLPPGNQSAMVEFGSYGLRQLRIGLNHAGLDPRYFVWPPENDPDRSPYPGLRPLEPEDAGIFFGREASTILVLDRLRGLRDGAEPRFLVIQGASGAGKSSFLRAGLIPRLKADDHHFLPLPIIRPEMTVLTGPSGLISSIEQAFKDQGQALNRIEIERAVEIGAKALLRLLERLSENARAPKLSGESPPPVPSLVISIDQGEELFVAESAEEAQAFLALVHDIALTPKPNILFLVTIRSDSYERMQTSKVLEDIRQEAFPLPPIPRGAYKIIIEGPAQRLEDGKRRLKIEPILTDRILSDIEECEGKDSLPLLAFTLERLFRQYGGDGDLRLSEYLELGGIAGSIEAAVKVALRAANADPSIPRDANKRKNLLRRALIPALAVVDPNTRTPRRRVARMSEIPEDTHGLVKCLIEARLLATDKLITNGRSETIIEPAHEALLRQWKDLNQWLKEDMIAILTLSSLQQAAKDWEAHDKVNNWLIHSAGRLEDTERLHEREDFAPFFSSLDQAYLKACRSQEEEKKKREYEEAKKLADAERRIIQRTRLGYLAATGTLIPLLAGIIWIVIAWRGVRLVESDIDFVLVSGGCFYMGSPIGEKGRNPNHERLHEVCVQPFEISKYTVTQADWQRVMPHNQRPSHFKGENLPVEMVSWNDVAFFTKVMTFFGTARYRLPSEEEWEYAARAGIPDAHFWGESIDDGCSYANLNDKKVQAVFPDEVSANCDDGFLNTAPVGSFKPNGFGLFDMIGNVSQWVDNCFIPEYSKNHADNRDITKDCERIARGGSWYSYIRNLRSASRIINKPEYRDKMTGFRLVRE